MLVQRRFQWLLWLLLLAHSSNAQHWVPLGPFSIPELNDVRDRSLLQAYGTGRVGDLKFATRNGVRHFYLCTPYNGYFESSDSGRSWQPGLSSLPPVGVADISFHPTRKEEILVATGDADCILDPNGPGMNSESCQSRGVYFTNDGGNTWVGPYGTWCDAGGKQLENFWKYPTLKVCRRLIRHPSKPNVLLATVTTNSFKTKKSDSYIFRTIDGGKNWKQVLFVPDGALKDLIVSPAGKNQVFAAGRTVYSSCDFGKNWTSLQGKGLPVDSLVNRCELAVTPAEKGKLFVLANLRSGKNNDLYILENRKSSFVKVCSGASSPEWRTALSVDAGNPQLIYFSAGNKVNRFEQVGASWRTVMAGNGLHDDVHELIPDPVGNKMYAATDGGLSVTSDSGRTWQSLNNRLNVAECWGIAVSEIKDTVRLLAGLQDCGTIQLEFPLDNISLHWKIVRGGDGMKPAVDPRNAHQLYTTDGNNNLNYSSVDAGASWKLLVMPRNQSAEYQRPFIVDPNNESRLYTGYGDVYRSDDRGVTWKKLGLPNSGSQKIIAIEVAETNSDIIYAAFSQPCWSEKVRSRLYRSSDGGITWVDISEGLNGASWNSISSIAIHPENPDKIIVGFRGGWSVKAMMGELLPDSIYHWRDISNGLPEDGDVNALCFDPAKVFELYAATHHGVWKRSGESGVWIDFNSAVEKDDAKPDNNLPAIFTSDIAIDTINRLIFAGTHGAGIWMCDLR